MQLPKFLIAVLTVSTTLTPCALAQDPSYNGPPPGQQMQGQSFPQLAPSYQGQQPPSGAYPPGAMSPQGQPLQNGQAPTFAAPPGYPQGAAMAPNNMQMQPMPNGKNGGHPAVAMSVPQWFNAYDSIRHQAQMAPVEKQRADVMLSKGVSMLVPGDEKIATKALLVSMVQRYQRACMQLKSLPVLNQTTSLHHMYYNYFATAGQLFNDYVRVQDNLFVTDATGNPVAASLMQRKQMLEQLEHQCKLVDAQTRQQFGIAPYPW